MSLPIQMPKPIWDEGVWSAIFGNGILISPDFCVPDLFKPVNAPFLDEWMDNPDVDGWYIGQVADLSSGC